MLSFFRKTIFIFLLLISTGTLFAQNNNGKIVIAVLPFKNFSDTGINYGDSTTDSLTAALGEISSLELIERAFIDSIIAENKLQNENQALFDETTIISQGKLARADYLVLGSVTKSGTRYELTARMVSGTTGMIIFSTVQKGEEETLFDLQELICQCIVAKMGVRLTLAEEEKLFPTGKGAFEIYLESIDNPDLSKRIELLEEAREKSPNYVPGLKLLADSYAKANRQDEAISVMNAVLELSPEDTEIRNRLAIALIEKKRIKEARLEFQRIVKEKPENADAWFNLGRLYEYNDAMQHLAKGSNLGEAENCYRKVIKLDTSHAESMYSLAVLILGKAGNELDLKRQVDMVNEAVAYLESYLILRPSVENAGIIQEEIKSYKAFVESAIKFMTKKKK